VRRYEAQTSAIIMPSTDKPPTANTAYKRGRRRLLSLHGWEVAMLWSLGGAALAAVAVVVSTAAVVVSQREENARTKQEFDSYKLEAAKDIAGAEERGKLAEQKAAEADRKAEEERLERLKLEALISPRSLTLDQQKSLIELSRPFAGMKVTIASPPMDGEALVLAQQLLSCMNSAGIITLSHIGEISHISGFVFGIHMTARTGSEKTEQFFKTLYSELASFGQLVNADHGNAAIPLMSLPNDSAIKDAVLGIFVGTKPVPTIK
jgi:hypothetical protein